MRVYIKGSGNSAKALASLIGRDPTLSLGSGLTHTLSLEVLDLPADHRDVIIDGVPGEFLNTLLAYLGRHWVHGDVRVQIAHGEVFHDHAARVMVPAMDPGAQDAERGMYRALLSYARSLEHPAPTPPDPPLPGPSLWQRLRSRVRARL